MASRPLGLFFAQWIIRANYFFQKKSSVQPVSDLLSPSNLSSFAYLDAESTLEKLIRVFFQIPKDQYGSQVMIVQVQEDLKKLSADFGYKFLFEVGEILKPCEILICYKKVPNKLPKDTLCLFCYCDQQHMYWNDLSKFDAVIVHSSKALADLSNFKNKKIYFIEEPEKKSLLEAGACSVLPSQKPGNILIYHGLYLTIPGLFKLRPVLEKIADDYSGLELRILTNTQARIEHWGKCRVSFLTYTEENFIEQSKLACLGIVPAQSRKLKANFFKPSSRMRKLFSVGVPAIGDRRSYMVNEFVNNLKFPADLLTADSLASWEQTIRYWLSHKGHKAELDELSQKGYACVATEYSPEKTARQWLNLLLTLVE